MNNKRRYRDRRGNKAKIGKIDRILIDVQRKLRTSYQSINLENLTAFERKRIHSFFDDRPEYKTKTYKEGNRFTLRVYPVGNIRKLAEEKARQALENGTTVALPPMNNYERFIVHDFLKDWQGIETCSFGEGKERHVEIRPRKFGRTLKKIIKRIKIF